MSKYKGPNILYLQSIKHKQENTIFVLPRFADDFVFLFGSGILIKLLPSIKFF